MYTEKLLWMYLFVPFLYVLPIMFVFCAWGRVWVIIFISVGGQQREIVFELQLVSSVCGCVVLRTATV